MGRCEHTIEHMVTDFDGRTIVMPEMCSRSANQVVVVEGNSPGGRWRNVWRVCVEHADVIVAAVEAEPDEPVPWFDRTFVKKRFAIQQSVAV